MPRPSRGICVFKAMITTILTIIHVAVCLFLIAIVLLQHGKGADMGATFGGSSQTVFGTEGPLPLLNKITTGAAVIFMLTSLGLAYFSSNLSRDSVMHAVKPPPPAVEGALERSPTTVPLPENQTAQPETAPQQFPGGGQQQAQAPVQEQAPATFPAEKSTPAAAPQEPPAAPPATEGEKK